MGAQYEATKDGVEFKSRILPNKNITPAQITSNQNNFNPPGLATCNSMHLSSSGEFDITGLQAPSDDKPQLIYALNVGNFTLTLKNESSLSLAANRFSNVGDFFLFSNEGAWIKYDPDNDRWRIAGRGSVPISEPLDWDADPATSPSEIVVGDMIAYELPDAATKAVTSNQLVPNNADLAVNPSLLLGFTVSSAGGGNANVRLQLNVKYIAIGEQVDKANDETLAQTVAVIDVLDEHHEVTFTLDASLIAQSDRISLKLERLGGDAADTFTGNIAIIELARLNFNRG